MKTSLFISKKSSSLKIQNLLLILVFGFCINTLFAQAPQKMSFQAVIRNASNTLVTNSPIGIKISVLQSSTTGTVVYSEMHKPTSNTNGLVTIEIGGGTVNTGDFATINWANSPFFIQTETDPTGGTNYTITATSQLMSVPYALYAAKSGNSNNSWSIAGNSGATSTSFIGTTDNVDLVFKRNNTFSGKLSELNTSIGSNSLENNTTGTNNSGFGAYALNNNADGFANTAIGMVSMFSNIVGNSNTAIGVASLRSNESGSKNTAVGSSALQYNLAGEGNTAIGFQSFYNGDNYSNSTAIGNGAIISASNQTRIGNSNVTSIGGAVGWTTISDKRFKTDIQDNVPGLAFIKKLKPVTYNLDKNAISRFLKIPNTGSEKEKSSPKLKQTGFLAQDVEQAAKEINYDFSGVDVPKSENDYYGLRYDEFVVPLVKAVQEQQIVIEQQNEKIKLLESRLKTIDEKLKLVINKIN